MSDKNREIDKLQNYITELNNEISNFDTKDLKVRLDILESKMSTIGHVIKHNKDDEKELIEKFMNPISKEMNKVKREINEKEEEVRLRKIIIDDSLELIEKNT